MQSTSIHHLVTSQNNLHHLYCHRQIVLLEVVLEHQLMLRGSCLKVCMVWFHSRIKIYHMVVTWVSHDHVTSAPSSSDGTAENSPRTPTKAEGQSIQGVYGLFS